MVLVTDGTADRAYRGVEKLSDENRKLIKQYAKDNMNVSTTAKHFHLHRNSLVYRLERVKKRTGLDPTYFFDLVALLVAIEESNKPVRVYAEAGQDGFYD